MVQAKSNTEHTVLITRFSAVGDIAMTIPLLYSLARTYPDSKFVFVSRERFGQFFIDCPKNLHFIGINLDDYKGLPGLYRLYKRLNEHKPDIVADLHDVLRTKILRTYFHAFSKAKVVYIDKGRKEKKLLTRSKEKVQMQLKSTFERYREVFASAGLPFTPEFKSLFGNGKGDISEFAGILPEKGEKKWVGIAPFAAHQGKIYPTDKMREVIALLSQEPDVEIFCFGNGPQEEEVVNRWCDEFPGVHSFLGRTNFNGELRLISHLDTMVCMDSANMHMASLAGTPAISIWGATSPLAGFLGWNQRKEDCIQLSLDCRPCSIFGNKPCIYGDYRCMDIPPQRIAEKIIEKIR